MKMEQHVSDGESQSVKNKDKNNFISYVFPEVKG